MEYLELATATSIDESSEQPINASLPISETEAEIENDLIFSQP